MNRYPLPHRTPEEYRALGGVSDENDIRVLTWIVEMVNSAYMDGAGGKGYSFMPLAELEQYWTDKGNPLGQELHDFFTRVTDAMQEAYFQGKQKFELVGERLN